MSAPRSKDENLRHTVPIDKQIRTQGRQSQSLPTRRTGGASLPSACQAMESKRHRSLVCAASPGKSTAYSCRLVACFATARGGHPCACRTENQQRQPSDTRRRQAHDTTIVLVATCILVCTAPFKLFEQFSDCAICRRQEKKARPLPKFSDHSRAQLHSSERKPQRECSHPPVFPGGLAKRERDIRRCISEVRGCWSNLSRFTHVRSRQVGLAALPST